MLPRGEPFPARCRNSFEKSEALKPNTPTKVSYVMPGIGHTFRKGLRLMVQIQSTWFPLVARNPQKFVPNYKLGPRFSEGDAVSVSLGPAQLLCD